MQVVRTAASSLIGIILLLLPLVAHASFTVVGNQLVVGTDSNVYRLKSDRLWQLSDIGPLTIVQQATFNGGQYLATQDADNNWGLYVSFDGLSYKRVEIPKLSQLKLVVNGGQLFVFGDTPLGLSSFVITFNGQVSAIPTINNRLSSQILSIIESGGLSILLLQDSSSLFSYSFDNQIWRASPAIDCQSARVVSKPVAGVYCQQQKTFLIPGDNGVWRPFFSDAISALAADELLAAVVPDLKQLIITDGKLLTKIDYDQGLIGEISSLEVYGSRVFIRSSHLYELIWSGRTGFELIDTDPDARIVPEAGSGALYTLGARTLYSRTATDSIAVTVPGQFNRAVRLNTGSHLAWIDGGSLSIYAPSGEQLFKQIPTSWSVSSKIKDISEHAGRVYALVVNSAGNYNLYSSESFDKWSRITLPTHPTIKVPIDRVRELPAGSLVETSGVITASPGIVADNIMYIQDELSGIQVYLSTSKGELPNVSDKQVSVTGEISSSAAKRIILDSPLDLEVTDGESISPAQISIDEIGNFLGRLVILRSRIYAIEKDFFSFNAVKVHGSLGSGLFGKGDLISSTAVVDYNSSSGNVELWQVGGAELIEPAIRVTAPTPVHDIALKTNSSLGPPANNSINLTPTHSVPTTVVSTKSPEVPLISAADTTRSEYKDSNQLETTILLSTLSFLCGVITVGGRRFKRSV